MKVSVQIPRPTVSTQGSGAQKLASSNCVKVSPSALVAVAPVEGLALGSYPVREL